MAKVTGLCKVKVNGVTLRSKPKAELKVGGPKQKAATDVNGFVGHEVEEIMPAEIKTTLVCDENTNPVALQQINGATVIFEADSGQSYMIRNAGTEGEVSWKGAEVEITLSGAPAELI